MEEPRDELVFSKKVMEFLTVANEFCLFVEECEKYDKAKILIYLEKVIPLLYLKGSLLPDVAVTDESANQRFVTEEVWENYLSHLLGKFGKEDAFYCNDTAADPGYTRFSLAEHIADIYQDMKDFIMLYQVNTMAARENAVYSCRLYFRNHWGYRALRASYAIHHILYGDFAGAEFPGYISN